MDEGDLLSSPVYMPPGPAQGQKVHVSKANHSYFGAFLGTRLLSLNNFKGAILGERFKNQAKIVRIERPRVV